MYWKLLVLKFVKMNRIISSLLGCALLLFFFGCGNAEKYASIYKAGRIWNYDVSITDSSGNIVDTFSLIKTSRASTSTEKMMGAPMMVCYEYKSGDSLLNKESTGVTDNEETSIYLHPPREYVLELTEITPFPRAHKEMKPNSWDWYQVKSELHIQKASYFDKGKNETINLAGKTIEQHLWAEDTTTITYRNEAIFCYILKGKNLNHIEELGEFKCTYFFNEKYGFVKWIYHPPWGDEVVISLRSTNF